jgi:peptide/nickel transport system permease protein
MQQGARVQQAGAADAQLQRAGNWSAWRTTIRAFRRDPAAVVALGVLTVIVLVTIAAPVISPFDPDTVDAAGRMAPPLTAGHLLGTDGQGRDMLTRILWGGRVSLPSALIPITIASLIGVTLGVIAGFRRGIVGELIMRTCDIFFAFPSVILAIAIAGVAGRGMQSVMTAVSIVFIPSMTRIAFGATRDIAAREFVVAAVAIGASQREIMLRHVLPNIFAPVVVYASTITGVLVVFSAGLSFLGLGIQPPTPDWGIMVSDGRQQVGEFGVGQLKSGLRGDDLRRF